MSSLSLSLSSSSLYAACCPFGDLFALRLAGGTRRRVCDLDGTQAVESRREFRSLPVDCPPHRLQLADKALRDDPLVGLELFPEVGHREVMRLAVRAAAERRGPRDFRDHREAGGADAPA